MKTANPYETELRQQRMLEMTLALFAVASAMMAVMAMYRG